MIEIKTERLTIYPLSDDEMKELIDKEADQALKAAFLEMLEGCKKDPKNRIWRAIWVLRNASGETVGTLAFKGLKDGMVEIGYGMYPEYEGKGLMTEAVTAVVRWASLQPGVLSIEAETEADKIASQKVLIKSGFVPKGENGAEGPRYIWKNKI